MSLPFGLRSAPKIFSAIADGLLWMIHEQGFIQALTILMTFCYWDHLHPLTVRKLYRPLSSYVETWESVKEEVLCRFVAYLGQQSLRHRTIKAYLSGIRFAHIRHGLGNPFQAKAMPLLEYVLSRIKREQARVIQQTKPCLPILQHSGSCIWMCSQV